MSTAQIEISKAEYDRLAHDVYRGIEVLRRLRAANVPAVGALAPLGVEYGSLTVERLPTGGFRWTWVGDHPFEDIA